MRGAASSGQWNTVTFISESESVHSITWSNQQNQTPRRVKQPNSESLSEWTLTEQQTADVHTNTQESFSLEHSQILTNTSARVFGELTAEHLLTSDKTTRDVRSF